MATAGRCPPSQSQYQFGVREFAMGTILGMALHGGLRVYGGTFFKIFLRHVKAAVVYPALQGLPTTYGLHTILLQLVKDGPTHEPIEHLAGLRAIPNLTVLRPADARETQAAVLAISPSTRALGRDPVKNPDSQEGHRASDKVAKGSLCGLRNRGADFDTILFGFWFWG